MAHASERTGLYRMFDKDGTLLYLGISYDPWTRWLQHRLESFWAHLVATSTTEWYVHRNAALGAEAWLTVVERPLYSVTYMKCIPVERRYWPIGPAVPGPVALDDRGREAITARRLASAKKRADRAEQAAHYRSR